MLDLYTFILFATTMYRLKLAVKAKKGGCAEMLNLLKIHSPARLVNFKIHSPVTKFSSPDLH